MSASITFPPALSDERQTALDTALRGLDRDRLWWVSGYAAGLASHATVQVASVPAPVEPAAAAIRLTVLYGSQTGNAHRIAETIGARASAAGMPVRVVRADAYATRELANERLLVVVISTQGDGDPPDDARGLLTFLTGARAPRLEALRFAVLGLGDSSYPQFCVMGERIDARLAELGGTRLHARGDADLDIDTVATPWIEATFNAAQRALAEWMPAPRATVTTLRPVPSIRGTREAPVQAEVIVNRPLVARARAGATLGRDIRHVEFAIDGLHYEPGDALGVVARNPDALVAEVIDTLSLDATEAVNVGPDTRPLHAWLTDHRELTRLARPFAVLHAARAQDPAFDARLADADAARLLLGDWQVVDLLQQVPAQWDAQALVTALRPLAPRLYSIASSQRAFGDEVHLTVARVQYERKGRPRWGAASQRVCSANEGDTLEVYIERNTRFRLPTDATRDIVMIGPGTGVAPFRGFLQDRVATGASGRNWLLFGNRHFGSEFLYQLEWQRALADGTLHRLDVAFSRDGHAVRYVQDRLREHGRALYDWIEGGAHLYVCGDATRMARDVDAALVDIIATHGAVTTDAARERVDSLLQQGRYARDVY